MRQNWAERILQAAMLSWPATLRLCLIVSVVAATSTIVVCLVDPWSLLVFME